MSLKWVTWKISPDFSTDTQKKSYVDACSLGIVLCRHRSIELIKPVLSMQIKICPR